MRIIAEIADKMPSTTDVVIGCLLMAGVSVALAWTHRAVAWAIFLLTLVLGGFFAAAGYAESFAEGSFSDAIRTELGGSWIAANLVGPLVPSICVAAVLLFRRWPTGVQEFPGDGNADPCLACGYDLRGTPRSSDTGGAPGRGKTCPECGAEAVGNYTGDSRSFDAG